MQKKYLLFAPGPSPIPPNVLLAMAEPIIHHRAPAYVKVLEEVREGLKYLFQTKNEVLIFASSALYRKLLLSDIYALSPGRILRGPERCLISSMSLINIVLS